MFWEWVTYIFCFILLLIEGMVAFIPSWRRYYVEQVMRLNGSSEDEVRLMWKKYHGWELPK